MATQQSGIGETDDVNNKKEFKRLLLQIKTGLTEDAYRDLLSLYDVKLTEERQLSSALQNLVSSNKLTMRRNDMRELIENLTSLGRDDLAETVEEFVAKYLLPETTSINIQETGGRGDQTLLVPNALPIASSTLPSQRDICKSIEETDSEADMPNSPLVPSPLVKQTTISESFPNKRHQLIRPKKKKTRLDPEINATDGSTREYGKMYNSELQEDSSTEEGEDLHFMQKAIDVSKKSPDPRTKVGAVLVKTQRVVGEGLVNEYLRMIIGEGYNRMPRGNEDISFTPIGSGEEDTKYPYVTHAAVTAIQDAYKKKEDVKGSTLYVTMYPSSRDGVDIVEAELKGMVYMDVMREENQKRYHTGATKRLLDGLVKTRRVKMPLQ